MPKVSICVPNLNTRPFLPERFATIHAQSFQDWEVLVYDSYSDDGAWEYIREQAGRDPRIRAWQGPREGTPASWNPCLRAAQGEYVYIATSDDTMAPDCLAQLVAALDAHPQCGLAHCRLRAIGERGEDLPRWNTWWSRDSLFAVSSGDLVDRPHVRVAPFDGLLHLLGETVYVSITQLLIRRSLFERIGYFERRWGSIGDFNWDMRAALTTDTVHVPGTWGGWRVHSGQATAGAAVGSPEHTRKMDDMIEHAVAENGAFIQRGRVVQEACDIREFVAGLQRCRTRASRYAFVLERAWSGSRAARGFIRTRSARRPFWPHWAVGVVSRWLDDVDGEPVLRLAPDGMVSPIE